jgi:hypothetical protein
MVSEQPARSRTTTRDRIEKMMATLAETATDRGNAPSERRSKLRFVRTNPNLRCHVMPNSLISLVPSWPTSGSGFRENRLKIAFHGQNRREKSLDHPKVPL